MSHKIISLGAITEIRIPNEKLAKFKTERGREMYIRNSVSDFINNGLKKIGIFDVYMANGIEVGYDDSTDGLCEINDFGFCDHNKVKQNPDKKTFRFFGGEILSIVPDVEVEDDKKFIGIMEEPQIVTLKKNELTVVTSAFQEGKNRNV